MKHLLLYLFTFPLFAVTSIIDCGSPQDQFFSGGIAYTVQPATDTTLRFSSSASTPFSYLIPVDSSVPYVVKLNFLEPSNVAPARAFSVSINDQLVLPRVTMPGYLVPFSRSFVVMGADGFLNIRFDTIIRSAVISSIEVTPLFQVLAKADGFSLIQAKCSRCHGNDLVAGQVDGVGGLDLRTKESMLAGGNRGPALIPGDPDNSLIYRFAARRQWPELASDSAEAFARMIDPSEDLAMPPFYPLSDSDRQVIRDWISAGAPRYQR